MPATATRPDAVAAAAVDLARAAVAEVAPSGSVGDHLGAAAVGERLVSHTFACTAKGYRGWVWTVTVARAPRARVATVCEVDLVAGEGSLLPPEWVPWSERLRPGDLGPGDVLPRIDDDERLEQGFEATGEEDVDRVALWELGLGRRRVLSREGRLQAGTRWDAGDFGPGANTPKDAAEQCRSCGFLQPVAGVLRQEFGICTNEWSVADGRVVSLAYGCGAHSETDLEPEPERTAEPTLDENELESVALADLPAPEPAPEPEPEPAPEPEAAEATPEAEAASEAVVEAEPEAVVEAAPGPADEDADRG